MSRPNLTEFALANPLYVWVIALTCLLGGLAGSQNIARLEDPPYPIKMAFVFTEYPGASALDVEREVSEVLERSIQELPAVDKLISRSLPGRSEIEIELKHSVPARATAQIWDELRRRVAEAALQLPAGSSTPWVEDDFGDVYGLLYGFTIPDGYPIAIIRDAARRLETEIKRVPHVGKVRIEGVPQEQIHIDFDYARLRQLGIPFQHIVDTIHSHSALFPGPLMRSEEHRLRIDMPVERDEKLLADLLITQPGTSFMIRLGDLATISRSETDLPPLILRHEGQRIFALGIAIDETQNVVEVGKVVEQRLNALQSLLPVGIEKIPLFEQHRLVDNAINQFLVNLAASVTTVIGALCLFMGWRAGVMVGAVLLMTVMGTIGTMAAAGIELQRISLGAMMIAMGMLVDNAIVVTEGMLTRIQHGNSPRQSATEAVATTRFPLLAATIIGVAAFAPIGLSSDSTGQFLGSLFAVCGISLLLSWVLAITIVPSLGVMLLKPRAAPLSENQLYGGPIFVGYRRLITRSIHRRALTTVILLGMIAASLAGFTQLKQGFFPATSTPLYLVDLYYTQGTDIKTSDRIAEQVRQQVKGIDGVAEVTSWAGQGPMRFTMILLPERPDPAYVQLVVQVDDVEEMSTIMAQTMSIIEETFPQIHPMVRRLEFTPGTATKIEARFFGEDREVLRQLAGTTMQHYVEHNLIDRKIDWREQRVSLSVVPDEARARRAGINLADVSRAITANTVGTPIATLRDGDKPVPIIARVTPLAESASDLFERDLWSEQRQTFIPASQVVASATLRAEDSFIIRRDRVRAITVQANAPDGQSAHHAFNGIRSDIESIALPPGYQLEWGGEYEAMQVANDSVIGRFPIALLVMVIATLVLFGNVRQTLVTWLTVPLIMIGVFLGLKVTDLSFTFPALLGLLSLIGILIKNCVIMVEEIKLRSALGALNQDTLVSACVSRMRPVLLAAGTTIAGMAPLLRDDFFREMAVSIMGGLAFGSLLTLLAVPVFYAVFFPASRESAVSK